MDIDEIKREKMDAWIVFHLLHTFLYNKHISKIIFKILPHNHLCIDLIQLITPVLVFLFLVACINIISENKIYRVLIGGR